MRLLFAVALFTVPAAAAYAYIGPGLGLGVLGALVGGVLALALALFGLVWYPLKRLTAKIKTGGRMGAGPRATTGDGPGANRPAHERHAPRLASDERLH